MSKPICHNCGKSSSCVGRYEGHGPFTFSCDECCGHGNEDGFCRPIEAKYFEEIITHVNSVLEDVVDEAKFNAAKNFIGGRP